MREEREGSGDDADLLRSTKRRELLERCLEGCRVVDAAAAVDLPRNLLEMAWGDLSFHWECSIRRSMGSRSRELEERWKDETKEDRCWVAAADVGRTRKLIEEFDLVEECTAVAGEEGRTRRAGSCFEGGVVERREVWERDLQFEVKGRSE